MRDLSLIKQLIRNLYADEIYEIIDGLKLIQYSPVSHHDIITRETETIKCPKCGSSSYYRNGHTKKNRQKYWCRVCGRSFSVTTRTIVKTTRNIYYNWICFIHFSLVGLTLNQLAYEVGISQTTAFAWRHKLFAACAHIREEMVLSGNIQIDGKFIPLNFKGTKTKNMPRRSKKRSSRSKSPLSHKVCILSAIDEHDHIFLIIGGLGEETNEMMKLFDGHIAQGSRLISDGKFAFETYARNNGLKIEIVKSVSYTNENGFNLAEINGIHSELETYLSKYRGVSTKHLQGYLDMFALAKMMRYTYSDPRRRDIFTYNKNIPSDTVMLIKDIYEKPWPVDINGVYKDND